MELVESYDNKIFITLKQLMERKASRDCIHFTLSQLAKALEMPHSMLVKLMHSDPQKRVVNPRIDTLTRIVSFFREEGFDVTIDDLLLGLERRAKTIETETAEIPVDKAEKTIPLYSFDATLSKKIRNIKVKLNKAAKSIIGLISEEDIKPFFKKGSIFIIDTEMKAEQDRLVAVRVGEQSKILIKRFSVNKKYNVLYSYDSSETPIKLIPSIQYSVIGVVIQINAKT